MRAWQQQSDGRNAEKACSMMLVLIAQALLLLLFNLHVEPYYVGLLRPQRYVYISPSNILVSYESVEVLHAEIPSFGQGRKRDKIRKFFKKQTDKHSLFLEVKVDGISETQRTRTTEINSLKWNEDLAL